MLFQWCQQGWLHCHVLVEKATCFGGRHSHDLGAQHAHRWLGWERRGWPCVWPMELAQSGAYVFPLMCVQDYIWATSGLHGLFVPLCCLHSALRYPQEIFKSEAVTLTASSSLVLRLYNDMAWWALTLAFGVPVVEIRFCNRGTEMNGRWTCLFPACLLMAHGANSLPTAVQAVRLSQTWSKSGRGKFL